MALVEHRFGSRGLYLLDEPESGLSVRRQIQLLHELHAHVAEKGSQVIIATHSPILLAVPGATIYRFGHDGIDRVYYEETEAFRLSRDFILDRLSGPGSR